MIAAVDRVLKRLLPLGSTRVVCTVAGESGVGKTTLAQGCVRALEGRGVGARVIHQDDYFHLPPRANHRRRCEDLGHVGPTEVDRERLVADLAMFRAGASSLRLPRVDAATDCILTMDCDVCDVSVLVVEGTYVTTLPDVDLRVFVRGSPESTQKARRDRARDPIEPITRRILAREHALIAPHEAMADLVLEQLSPR
ncbi:MAG TPA: hypothetical protein ENK57_09170 [Polyangiaceae bacterium]|nr:hypothetical protein [Polyangiaceae bacterium]